MSKVKRLFGGGRNRQDEAAETVTRPNNTADQESNAALIQENARLNQRNRELLQDVKELGKNNEKMGQVQYVYGSQGFSLQWNANVLEDWSLESKSKRCKPI